MLELRELYERLSTLSTERQKIECAKMKSELGSNSNDDLIKIFIDTVEKNQNIPQIDCGFVPDSRKNKRGTNPVVEIMEQKPLSKIKVSSETGETYNFTFCCREVPHLRGINKVTTKRTWIDYVGFTDEHPILGEIKWKSDKNPFYAFIQLLTYLSEIATKNQIKRALEMKLFGDHIKEINAFDLHIFLVNFNLKSKKFPLINDTKELVKEFKTKLKEKSPEVAKCVGKVLCVSGLIEENGSSFSKLAYDWLI